jgi:hypothetical protein
MAALVFSLVVYFTPVGGDIWVKKWVFGDIIKLLHRSRVLAGRRGL